jgi:predicted nucleic-acid-binding Zn-ribbon protein
MYDNNLSLPICPACKDTKYVSKKVKAYSTTKLELKEPIHYYCTSCGVEWHSNMTQEEITNILRNYQIEQYNFQISFYEDEYVLKQITAKSITGGKSKVEATQIKGKTPFGVLSVKKSKERQCSDILVWDDGVKDGGHYCSLINVPNGLFRREGEVKNDNS